ncbi:PREDICTED: nitrogen permease regulator 2-like protein [Papilio xuthus]|uniref:Nitrogen permease regulator 2-like protein n=1 Tax=Papilio xuthus TaxID=66420 RepID=A0A194PRZ5_PAPXU|nr:PREDICTED: nitrogen permease regulator 2-like protein [Papilio xuthus]KPI95728.1 Nitrogen permease regulator 2-like protein [Papilio xuthus]
MDANAKYYEGCGQEGPIRCIFLCEFHHTAGPKITCQVPENYISKDIFDTVSHYIIPKVQLQRCTLTVTLLGSKILGFPVRIDNKKYARNAFYFNLCFVCDAWARTVHLEPLVKKLTEYLLSMELETEWLSKQSMSGDAKDLGCLMKQVMQDINCRRMCTLTVGTTTTHLTVVRVNSDPAPVKDHQVPVFLYSRQSFVADQWDLTTNQILPYIDGFNHVSKIAALTDVEVSLVRACVQNLVYYGVITLVPIFQYCAVYSVTPKLRQLTRCAGLQRQCIEFCARSPRQLPKVNDLFVMYAGMSHGSTVRDLCRRLRPQDHAINERKLVLFGVLEGLIRRVYKYPITLNNVDTASVRSDHNQNLVRTYNGLVCLDELCCHGGLSVSQLEEQLERDSNVVFIVK